MTIIEKISDLKKLRSTLYEGIGFVPTMGALHAGHLSLIQQSVRENDKTFVSIFVNPTQFLENEDINSYPRQIKTDLDICSRAGVDFVFLPSIKEMYSDSEPMVKVPKKKGYVLEGEKRPGHFDGVLTIVLKLLCLVRPNRAYFGKKDAQQLYFIENMVKNFHLLSEIVPCEIVRQQDGLALSSRNVYLDDEGKIEALKLSKSLKRASELILRGDFNSKTIKQEMMDILSPLRVDYVEIVDREFNLLQEVELKNTIILVAAYVQKARLIDNMWV